LEDIIKKYSPEAIRLALLSTHYRSQLDLTDKKLKESESNIVKIRNFYEDMNNIKEDSEFPGMSSTEISAEYELKLEEALDDDLNISKAISVIFGLMKNAYILRDESKLGEDGASRLIGQFEQFNEILRILPEKETEIDESVYEMIKQREDARLAEDWALSDKIREELFEMGYNLEDTPRGTVPKRRK